MDFLIDDKMEKVKMVEEMEKMEKAERKAKKTKPIISKWKLIFLILGISGTIALIVKMNNTSNCPTISCNSSSFVHISNPSISKPQCVLNENHNTLILTQVLFRHGERTPMDIIGPYPKDPYKNYTYEPYGPGSLTDIGKQSVYGLGKYLKSYYCDLLKDYHRDIVYALSSPFPRCRITLLTVLAAMFPPENSQYIADGLDWQPIPYDTNEFHNDTTFLYFANCNKYTYLYRKETQKSVENNDVKDFKELLEKLFIHTGANFSSYRDVFNLHGHLKLQKEFGLRLPPWTKEFMPILEQFEILAYNISSRTEELKTVSGGFILTEIIKTMKSKIHNPKMNHRKIHLYSGHDFTIANLMGALGLYSNKKIPYVAFLSVELHKINTEYAVKILYHQRPYDHPEPLILKGCNQELCPLDTFIEIYGKYMATPNMCILDQQLQSNTSEYFAFRKS